MTAMFRQNSRFSPSAMHRLLVCGLLMLALALSACSRRQAEWEMARAADTVESYERFLRTFPDGEFSAEAQARAAELREAGDWKKAVSLNTLGAYQQFVAEYPDGRMSDEARIRIESFTLAAGSPGAVGTFTADAVSVANAPMAPAGTPAAPAASATAAGAFRIQLGAFTGGEKQAMGEWRRLQRDYAGLLDGLSPSVKLATTTSGHLYRLQAGSMSEPRARAVCARLQADGQACVVVLP